MFKPFILFDIFLLRVYFWFSSCRLVTPETMMSFLCTEFSYTEKHSINLIYRFEIYITVWEIRAYP